MCSFLAAHLTSNLYQQFNVIVDFAITWSQLRHFGQSLAGLRSLGVLAAHQMQSFTEHFPEQTSCKFDGASTVAWCQSIAEAVQSIMVRAAGVANHMFGLCFDNCPLHEAVEALEAGVDLCAH